MYRIPGCYKVLHGRDFQLQNLRFRIMGYDHRCVIKEVKKKMFLTWKKNRRAEQQLFGEVGFRLWTIRDREWVFQLAEQRSTICRQTAQRLFSHLRIDRTWQSFAVKICPGDTFPNCTLTFLFRNLSRNLPSLLENRQKHQRRCRALVWQWKEVGNFVE